MGDLNTFSKKINQKVETLERRKQDFERYLIFLNTKMSAKLNKIGLGEEFIAMLREERSLWDVMSPLHRDRNEKEKSLKRISDKFQIFSD